MAEARLRLIAWNKADAAALAVRLRSSGFVVGTRLPGAPALLRELAKRPPAAIVIDLGRLPSQGRDLAVALRLRKGTRDIPLVFLGGQAVKVAAIRRILPDATFTSAARMAAALRKAITRPRHAPTVPRSVFAPYAGASLAKKLGLRQGMVVTLVGAPQGADELLHPLPADVRLNTRTRPGPGMTIWFVRDRRGLESHLPSHVDTMGAGPLWIAWPKVASGVRSDLTQATIRAAGLSHGLVDYKICSIDGTWSALLFRRRTQNPRSRGR